MYGVDGARELPERELDHLPGYADSRPVRIGNAAVDQRQNDVLGEVMGALELARQAGIRDSADSWSLQRHARRRPRGSTGTSPTAASGRSAASRSTSPTPTSWSGPPSTARSRAVERHGLDGPVERWRALRDEVRQEVLTRGYDRERGTFVQHYGTKEVDASLLLIPTVGFLPPTTRACSGTIRAVEEDLMHEGLLLRYRTGSGVDGLAGDEHPFLACSFWLVSAYAGAGRDDEAHTLMKRLVSLSTDLGLLAEEYDPVRERMVGNFPQAFCHLALISAAVRLGAMTSHLHDNLELLETETRCAAGHRDPAGRRVDDRAEPVRGLDPRPRRDARGPQRRRPVPPRALGDHRRPHPDVRLPRGPGRRHRRGRPPARCRAGRRPRSPPPPGSPRWRPRSPGPARSGRWRCAAAGWCTAVTCRPCDCARSSSTTSTWTWASRSPTRTPASSIAPCAARSPRWRTRRRRRRCGSAATRATSGRSATVRRTSPAAGRACCCGSPGAGRTRSRPTGRCRPCLAWG